MRTALVLVVGLIVAMPLRSAHGLKLAGHYSVQEQVAASDTIFIGVATDISLVASGQDNTIAVDQGIASRVRMAVKVTRTIWPSQLRLAETVQVIYGYNADVESEKSTYLGKPKIFLVRGRQGSAGYEPSTNPFSFWFTVPPEDEELISELLLRLERK